jgi:hypothetical protein
MTLQDLNKSLQEIDGIDYGDPSTGYTSLMKQCMTARRVPVCQLQLADLRVLLEQKNRGAGSDAGCARIC